MKYVGVKTTGELRLHEVKEPQTDEIYMAVEDDKLGAVPIRPYEFVKWDGAKWIKVPNVQLVTTLDISPGTSQSNPLMNAEDVEQMILKMLPPGPNTLRFKFSKKDYSPVTAGAGEDGTWTKINPALSNIWDWTKNGTDFSGAFDHDFQDEDNLVSVIAAGDTSSVTDMSHMFEGNHSLVSVTLFDTSSVTNMKKMFAYCSSLTSVPLFNTESVTNMNSMFENCTSLTSIPLFNTASVTNIGGMFWNCSSLTSVPPFNTESVTDMSVMFEYCSSLTSVPLFNTASVTNMAYMFNECRNVKVGSLALYRQASTQENIPSEHTAVFVNCGINTTTGAAELAQIPASWGGLAEG